MHINLSNRNLRGHDYIVDKSIEKIEEACKVVDCWTLQESRRYGIVLDDGISLSLVTKKVGYLKFI